MRRRQIVASGEDFVDEQIAAVALLRSLLVVARDHLADQPEREELHSDHDEQHAEQEKWALPDRVSKRLDHGEVDENRGADQTEQEPKPTEEVQWPVPVAADERDRQQVEEAPQVTLDSIARAAGLARAMVDG